MLTIHGNPHSTFSANNTAKKEYKFQLKNSNLIGVIALVGDPADINKDAARSILIDSFIGEYEQYLLPEEVDTSLTSWRNGENSAKQYYENYFVTEHEEFAHRKLHYWVEATVDGKLVGWATFQREEPEQNGVYMNLLVVDPKYQHKGIGEQLVKSLINLNEIADLKAINLLLRKKNQAGRKFYTSLGFSANTEYHRDNFVDVDLLEGFTWKNLDICNKLLLS